VWELPRIDVILMNPLEVPVPDHATQHASASALARCASDTNIDRVLATIEGVLYRVPIPVRNHKGVRITFIKPLTMHF
jgi:hypothetical protein